MARFYAADPPPDAKLLVRARAGEVIQVDSEILLAAIEVIGLKIEALFEELDIVKLRLTRIYQEVRPYEPPAEDQARVWK